MSIYICSSCQSISHDEHPLCPKCHGKLIPLSTYNIHVQFPNHHFQGPVTVKEGWGKLNSQEIVTTFTFDGPKISPEEKELLSIFAEFYDLNGVYVAAKLRHQLGEIWLGNHEKSTYSYHYTGVWPHSVNFGELCSSSNPTLHLEVTWKYKEVKLLAGLDN